MIYTANTKLAMNIAYNAHKDQYDKCGSPYIFHPIHVAEQMKEEKTTIVALLHDVIEDTEVTFEELKKSGFNEEVLSAIKVLTKLPNEEYFKYIETVCRNDIAIKVKLEDLKHNSNLSRFDNITDKEIIRKEKYDKAIKIIEEYFKEEKK